MLMRVQGWTLVETMVVVGLVAVLAALAIPSFVVVIQQARLSTATHELMSAISLARSEAIKRNARVVLCVANGEASTCALTGNWQQGWLLFEDVNHNGLRDNTERVIRQQPAFHSELVIQGNGPVSRYVSFLGTGRSQLLSGAMQAGTISLCHRNSGVQGRAIVMNVVGRPRVKTWTPTTVCA